MSDEHQSEESDRQRHAFDVYLGLGEKRTYGDVARRLGVSLRSVKNWAKRHSWRERAEELDIQDARKVVDQSLAKSDAETERNLKIVRAALIRIAKGIAEGKVRMQMGDLDRLIRLEEHLMGKNDPAGPDINGRQAGGQVVLYLPDNGRTGHDKPLPTASELGLNRP